MVEGIGTWVRLHPAAFLTDQYLKYIAWALSDKVGGCDRQLGGARGGKGSNVGVTASCWPGRRDSVVLAGKAKGSKVGVIAWLVGELRQGP